MLPKIKIPLISFRNFDEKNIPLGHKNQLSDNKVLIIQSRK